MATHTPGATMTVDLRELVAQLRELAGKATPGPWASSALQPFYTVPYGQADVICSFAEFDKYGRPDLKFENHEHNQAFIVALVNALPAILDSLDEKDTVRVPREMTLEMSLAYWETPGDQSVEFRYRHMINKLFPLAASEGNLAGGKS